MKQLKIALTALAAESGISQENWKTVPLKGADLTDVSAVVMTSRDEIPAAYDTIHAFSIPLFILDTGEAASRNMSEISGTLLPIKEKSSWKKRITRAALQYEKDLLPPFFGALMKYTSRKNDEYDSPGHQGGAFFRKHPAGRIFYYYYGPNVFRGDLSSSDVDLGDFLIHEGAALSAQKHAAKVFHADKTYFVLNGTSTSNKIVMNAVLAPGDMVLYDRNNHKSIDLGLVLSGAIPVYMETARNACGSIGGIPERCFDEDYIRKLVAEKDPEKAKAERPIRLAVIELGTYDGCMYNARQVIDRIGYLCDYIFFDSAWVGYEQFIPMMKDASPLLLELGPDDPGIFVTQSVHKQQAGFSMTSQIHKKDAHIRGQQRYVPHKRMNNAYMMHASTSPFYQLFAVECYAKTGQGWDKNLDSLCSILESELKTLDATFRFHTGGSLMKYTKKERMNIGRQIYEDQINKYEAAGKYGISAQTAREYMRMYRNTNHLPPKTSKPRDYGLAKAKVIPEAAKLDEYQKMSKEDLISALIDARIREERLKLGYEVVEEDDSKKKLITYVKKTAK